MLGWFQGTSNSGFKCTFSSSTWITCSAPMLNNTTWVFRKNAERFYFPSPEFFRMIHWELFKWIPRNVALNQGTTITCANVYHWGVKLCHQHPDPADTHSISLCYTKHPSWQKPSWSLKSLRSLKRKREKSNRPPEWLIEGWGQVICCSHQK